MARRANEMRRDVQVIRRGQTAIKVDDCMVVLYSPMSAKGDSEFIGCRCYWTSESKVRYLSYWICMVELLDC